MAQPTTHADYRLGLLLKEGGWTIEELLECVDEMTLENLTNFIPQFLARYCCIYTIHLTHAANEACKIGSNYPAETAGKIYHINWKEITFCCMKTAAPHIL